MTGVQFVRQVMSQLEVSTPAALAEKMRWRRGMERTIARWLAGTSEPSFAYTMDMANRTGMFSTDGVAAQLVDQGPRLEDLLEEVAANQEQMLENQKKGTAALAAQLRAVQRTVESLAEAERIAPRRSRRTGR